MNLKQIKKEKFNKKGIFFTSNSLALYLKDELYRYSKEEWENNKKLYNNKLKEIIK